LQECEAAQVPCGMVAAIDEIFEDPQYAARENIVLFQDDRAGEVAVQNVVPRMSGTPGGIEWLGPAVGAHNAEVYGELLGIDDARLKELTEAGVI
jgi:succinyl-CoA:(S)-malate CoA-transferase subunit B